MAEKVIKSRIVHNHATEAVWDTHSTFIPKNGELIVFDADATHSAQRLKIGDGTTLLSALPFVSNDAATKLVDTTINTSSPGTNVPTSTAVVNYVSNSIPYGIRIDSTINTTDWTYDSAASKYKATITNQNVTSDMSVLELYVDRNVVRNEVVIVTYDGRAELFIEEQPSVIWDQLHMVLFSCNI